MTRTPSTRALFGLVSVVALPIALAAGGHAGAAAPPTSPPPSSPDESVVAPPGEPSDPGQPGGDEAVPPGFVALSDDTGLLTVLVPDSWTDVDTRPAQNDDGSPRPMIVAAPDIEQFQTTFDVPGVLYAAFPYEADPQLLIDQFTLTQGCESIEVEPYEDPVFAGLVQVGTNCGDGDATWNMVAASPADQSFTALVQVQTSSPDDQEAFDNVLRSFNVTAAGTGTGPGSSVPASSVPGDGTPSGLSAVEVTERWLAGMAGGDATAVCEVMDPAALEVLGTDQANCVTDFQLSDEDTAELAEYQVVGEVLADSDACTAGDTVQTTVVELTSPTGSGCVTLVAIDDQWLVGEFLFAEA